MVERGTQREGRGNGKKVRDTRGWFGFGVPPFGTMVLDFGLMVWWSFSTIIWVSFISRLFLLFFFLRCSGKIKEVGDSC